MGSLVVALGPSCSRATKACGILVTRPGIEPTSPALESQVLITGLSGESLLCWFLYIISNMSIDAMNTNAKVFIVLGFFRERESIGEIWRDRQRESRERRRLRFTMRN